MHAVAPIVLGVGRDIDALLVDIRQTEFLVDGQPVLQGEDGQQRRTVQVTADNIFANPAGSVFGHVATAAHDIVIIA